MQRVAGATVLFLAAVLLFAVPRLISDGLTGSARLAPLPAPPPVGSCVMVVGPGTVAVPCSQPHDAEVALTWSADDPQRWSADLVSECAAQTTSYPAVDTDLAGWTVLALDIRSSVLVAPPWQSAGATGWAACLLEPRGGAQTVGSLRELGRLTDRSPAFGNCLDGLPRERVDCTAPHAMELLGVRMAKVSMQPDAPLGSAGLPTSLWATLRSDCQDLATVLTASADPSFGAQVSVAVEAYPVGTLVDPAGGSVDYTATCLLRTLGPRLMDSLVGWGDAPLPYG